MATYNELREIAEGENGADIRNRLAMAVAIKAHAILQTATPSQAEKDWALEALQKPHTKVDEMVFYLVADNAAQTVAAILVVTDAVMQARVNDAVDALVS